MNRKICVITGTRAEYGLLRWLMHAIRDDSRLSLQIIVTGSHLSPEFGLTYKEIEEDGFVIDSKVRILTSADSALDVAKSMGRALTGFADAMELLEPDMIVVLGDRYEVFSAVATALVMRIPVAHLHGGELTTGAIDDAFRHAITKMSHLHFVAAQEYYNRVIQMGESPERVFLVGGLGVDAIRRVRLMGREELEASLNFKFGDRNLLVTFHPPTLDVMPAIDQIRELLAALDMFPDIHIIFTSPNADTDGRKIKQMIEGYTKHRRNACLVDSLGQQRYFSCISYVDGVVGNSSSGLTEVPSFKKGTVNIGDRQMGRLCPASVINCEPELSSISSAIQKLYSSEFQASLGIVVNPYGDGGASEKIVGVIGDVALEGLVRKQFRDLESVSHERGA